MITFLSSPKPFLGKDKENQYRAIKSWLHSVKGAEVILYGNSEGIEIAGRDLNVKVINVIESTKTGLPFFGAIVNNASENAIFDNQIYLNCDIVLSNLQDVFNEISSEKFLLVGQRIDLSKDIIPVVPPNFKNKVCKLYSKNLITLHEAFGIDYFAFKRGTFNNVPTIIIGRGGYDNAILSFCKATRIPIIDCTFSILAQHQFHDYNHVNGEINEVFQGDEARINFEACNGKYSSMTIADANYIYKNRKFIKLVCRGDRLRNIELIVRHRYKMKYMSLILRMIWKLLFLLKIIRKKEVKIEQILESVH